MFEQNVMFFYVGLSWCFSCGRPEKKILPRCKVFGSFFVVEARVKKCRYLGNDEYIVVGTVFDGLLNYTVVTNWRHYVWYMKNDIAF